MPPPAKHHPALQLLRNHPERFTRQGSIVATWRTYRGRRLGPYYRLVWRENGRQRTLYLGRQGPIVDEVRRLLGIIQAPTRLQRIIRKRRAGFRREVLRPLKRYLDETFLVYGGGLYLKGWELRGHYARAGKLPPLRLPPCGFSDSSTRLDPLLRAEGSRHRPIPPPLPGTVPAGPPPKFPFPPIAPIAEALPPEQAAEHQLETPNPSAHPSQLPPSAAEKRDRGLPCQREQTTRCSPEGNRSQASAMRRNWHSQPINHAQQPPTSVTSLTPLGSSLIAHRSTSSCLENRPFVTQNPLRPRATTWLRPRGPPGPTHLVQRWRTPVSSLPDSQRRRRCTCAGQAPHPETRCCSLPTRVLPMNDL